MALIGNNSDTLFNGLSAFWHRFFRDVNDLKKTYEGTEILLGQTYLNFLSDVLNTSIVEAPLFRKEFYKLITIREDQIVFKEQGAVITLPTPPLPKFYGNPGSTRYVYAGDTFYGAIPQIQNTIFAPTNSLEVGVDYRVAGGEIQFKIDPTDPAIPGFAQRRLTVGIGGKFTSTTTTDWIAAGVKKGDTLYYSESIDLGTGSPLSAQDDARVATIVHVTATHLSVSIDTPFPTFPAGAVPTGFSWRVMRLRDDGTYNTSLPRSPAGNAPFNNGQIVYTSTLDVTEVALWAVDAQVDDLTIYNNYGYFFTNKQLSSETYRALIRGLMQLYIMGPALARLESALNLTASLPTILEEGEILSSYTSGIDGTGTTGTLLAGEIFEVPTALFTPASVGGYIKIKDSTYAVNIGSFNIIEYISPTQVKLPTGTAFIPDTGMTWLYTRTNKQVVETDRNTYIFPLEVPIRDDVKDLGNVGTLTFEAFETITTAVRVTDYISDPEWWHTITIPQEILPDWTAAQRAVTPQLYPNVIGPTGNFNIGDPQLYLGMDENGNFITAPPTPPYSPAAYRHKAAFILMDRFLKLHMFAVIVDPSIALTSVLVTDLQKILRDVKPVHTQLYFSPVTFFNDVINISEEDLNVGMARRRLEKLGIIDNPWLLGSGWNIGDTWKFSGTVGGGITINPPSGGMYVGIGSADPLIQPTDPTNIPPATDPPLYTDPLYPTDCHWIDRPLHVYMHP